MQSQHKYHPKFQAPGLFFNCAMNSRGIQASGGLGREMATLVCEGRTDVDLFSHDISRFQDAYVGDQRWQDEGTHEKEVRCV